MRFCGITYTEIHGDLLCEDLKTVIIHTSSGAIVTIPKQYISNVLDFHTWKVETWFLKRFRIIPLYP